MSSIEKLTCPLLLDELPEALDGVLEDEDGVLLEDDDEGVLLVSDDDEDGVLDDEDDGEDDEDDWATASVDSAKSTAALRMLRVLGIT